MNAVSEIPEGDAQHEIEDRAKYWGIPIATLEDMNFGTWDSQRTGKGIKEATEYASAFSQGKTDFTILTLVGPRGVGKTHLALAVAWNCLMNGYLVYYRQSAVMLDMLRKCFNQTAKSNLEPDYDWHMDTLMNRGMLILDDLGAEKPTDWAEEKLDMIIDHRWLNRLPLMVTTNALSEDLAPRIADRIADVHRAKVVTIVATSCRRGESAKR
jgi:DNA replication protein DnaC